MKFQWKSDIDMILILDWLTFEDLKQYKQVIDALEHHKLICGFIDGKVQLIPLCKDLSFLKEQFSQVNIQHAVSIVICNLYHATIHL